MASPIAGDRLPEFAVHGRLREVVRLQDLIADGAAVFHFYVLDFTGGPEGG